MKLKVNPEYLKRHLFAIAVIAGLGGWFAWDGAVAYPRLAAADLYREIERADPPAVLDVEAFKLQKIRTQYAFAASALGFAAWVAFGLLRAARFRFEYDDGSVTCAGERIARSAITKVDRTRWERKGILVLTAGGRRITLDAWHHLGVREFERTLC